VNKGHLRGQGIVGNNSTGHFQAREIFTAVDPMELDIYEPGAIQEMLPSGAGVDFNPTKYLPFLPELEQEIFFLCFTRNKEQKEIAKLLGLSQPTVSYRYRRVLAKLHYLIVLDTIDAKKLIDDLAFLRPKEKDILFDLLYYTNQELVGRKHQTRQSSVKWILVKSRRNLKALEPTDPDKWHPHYGLLALLERNLSSRILH
jgi:hypothetical protein